MSARKAVFAGSWYPASAGACAKEIDAFSKVYDLGSLSIRNAVGGIVPHAGWYFSGAIACNVIRCLAKSPPPDVIVLFGMHLSPDAPNYIMAQGAWETPFGDIAVEERVAAELIRRFDFALETARDYQRDNTIELQLPFIKYFFENAKIVPIGAPPRATSIEIGQAVAEISTALGIKIRAIGSTDLTHYGFNYGFSPRGSGPAALEWVREENDKRVIDAMLALDGQRVISEGLSRQNACCAGAAAAALSAGRALGADQPEVLAYASSHDKSPGDSFVGYAGIVF